MEVDVFPAQSEKLTHPQTGHQDQTDEDTVAMVVGSPHQFGLIISCENFNLRATGTRQGYTRGRVAVDEALLQRLAECFVEIEVHVPDAFRRQTFLLKLVVVKLLKYSGAQ